MDGIENFTESEFQRVFDIQYKKAITNKNPNVSPKAYILGGQPGAGKSTLIKLMKEKLKMNVVVISGDDYRKIHPHFKELYAAYGDDYVNHTAKFSSKMVEQMIETCSSQGYHLIVEGTLRNHLTPLYTGKLLAEQGYEINLAVMAVSPTLSYMGTLTRYETMLEIGTVPRVTTMEQHDRTAKQIVENIGKVYETGLFDNILIYNREWECLYDYSKTPELNPKNILRREHGRSLTKQEQIQYKNDYMKVRKNMLNRGDERVAELEKQFRKNTLNSLRRKKQINHDMER